MVIILRAERKGMNMRLTIEKQSREVIGKKPLSFSKDNYVPDETFTEVYKTFRYAMLSAIVLFSFLGIFFTFNF